MNTIFFDLFGVLIDYNNGQIKTLSIIDRLNIIKQKYSLWIISNTTNHQINNLKTQFNFFDLFDGIITSESAKYSKPDYRIFNYALKIAKTKPNSSIFIDDLQNNLNSAKKLGFNTFHISEMNLFFDFINNK